MRALVRFVATAFVLGSLLAVALAGACAAGGGQAAVMRAEAVESFALTYAGRRGALLALAEVALVALAWLASRSARGGLRRTGLLALCAWVCLWMVNGWRWWRADPAWMSSAILACITLAVLGSFAWLWIEWARGTGLARESGSVNTDTPS